MSELSRARAFVPPQKCICQATECVRAAAPGFPFCMSCNLANNAALIQMGDQADNHLPRTCTTEGCNYPPEAGYASCTDCREFVRQYGDESTVNQSEILSEAPLSKAVSAPDVLRAGAKHMEDRAATYDKPGGERSIYATVTAFNAITGHNLTAEQGWLFMGVLKDVRSQSGKYKADNYEDRTAYAGLQGEAAAQERQ